MAVMSAARSAVFVVLLLLLGKPRALCRCLAHVLVDYLLSAGASAGCRHDGFSRLVPDDSFWVCLRLRDGKALVMGKPSLLSPLLPGRVSPKP